MIGTMLNEIETLKAEVKEWEAWWEIFQSQIEVNPNDADLGALVREKYAEVREKWRIV